MMSRAHLGFRDSAQSRERNYRRKSFSFVFRLDLPFLKVLLHLCLCWLSPFVL